MTRVSRSALVPFEPQAMFDLVADVEAYPAFLPWCATAEVRERSNDAVTASMEVAKGPLRRRFTTRNRLQPGERIDIQLVDGPFRRLEGTWRFEPAGDSGCRISLDLEFDFSSPLLRRTLGPIFNRIADSMVDAFCRRAHEIHRGGPSR